MNSIRYSIFALVCNVTTEWALGTIVVHRTFEGQATRQSLHMWLSWNRQNTYCHTARAAPTRPMESGVWGTWHAITLCTQLITFIFDQTKVKYKLVQVNCMKLSDPKAVFGTVLTSIRKKTPQSYAQVLYHCCCLLVVVSTLVFYCRQPKSCKKYFASQGQTWCKNDQLVVTCITILM